MIACQKQEVSQPIETTNDDLYAQIESVESTKTTLDSNHNVLWSTGDQLTAFMKNTLRVKYQIKEEYVGTNIGGFSKVVESNGGDDLESGQEMDHNVVLYPYNSTAWCMKNDNNDSTSSYKVNLTLPSTQIYAYNSFADDSFPMIAVSSDNKLKFMNVCGGIKLQIKGNQKIKSIILEGNGEESISGKANIICFADNSAPYINMADDATKSITLDCGDGVQLDENVATIFIIAIPPMTFESGLKITVTDSDGLSKTFTNSTKNTIKRATLLSFPAITYIQEGYINIEDKSLSFPFEAQQWSGTYSSNLSDLDFVIPDEDKGWISINHDASNKSFTINVLENIDIARSSTIRLESKTNPNIYETLSISQAGYNFNKNHCIYYKENMESIYEDDYDSYIYRTYFNCASMTATEVEMKFKLNFISGKSEGAYLLCDKNSAKDSADELYATNSYIYIYDSDNNSYSWYWKDLGISPSELINLKFSGIDQTLTINGNVLSCPGLTKISVSYVFSGYYRDSDEGEVDLAYYGVPEGSELYYVKIYNSIGNVIYVGHPKYDTQLKQYYWYSNVPGGTGSHHYANEYDSLGGFRANF